jgi:hypothetical protein
VAELDVKRAEPFSDQAKGFIGNYSDPCGSGCDSLDSARCPDAATQTSAGGFLRGNTTLVFPWQTNGSILLDGLTYSMLLLQLPVYRSLTFVIAKQFDGEFGPDVMEAFCFAFANLLTPDTAFYPNWIPLTVEGVYMTSIDTAAMRNVVPPGPTGVSGTIDSFRFTSQGMTCFFNTPTLLDQGTYTAMRYPSNIATQTFEIPDDISGAHPFYLHGQITPAGGGGFPLVVINNAPFNVHAFLPSFSGPATLLPSTPFAATATVRNSTNSFNVAIGNLLQYTIFAGTEIRLTNVSNASFINLGNITTGGLISSRLYTTTTENVPDAVVDAEFTVLTLPPVTQADMFQQDPKAAIELLKDTEGVYLVSAIFQPIFNLQSASAYRKIICVGKDTDLVPLLDSTVGWPDTFDLNFGVSVVNFQGMPYACKPMIKIARSVEIVPSADSIVGMFATGSPPEQAEVADICRGWSVRQPHGHPVNWNGMGILFGKVMNLVEQIPTMLRTGANISRGIKRVCDEELPGMSEQMDQQIIHGLRKLMMR